MSVPGRKANITESTELKQGSGEVYEIFCQPCDRDDIRLPAFCYCTDCEEHLCESCLSHHKRAKPSRHHTIRDKHNMPRTLQTPKPYETRRLTDLSTPCSKHTKEEVKFYCNDHNDLLCSVCVTLEHPRSSCRVDYIPDISDKSLNSKEYTDILKEIDKLQEKYETKTENMKRKVGISNESVKTVLTAIKRFRQEVNDSLDGLEKKANDLAMSLQQENDLKLKRVETTRKDAIESLTTSCKNIRKLNDLKQADILFTELKSVEKKIRDQEKRLLHLPSSESIHEFTFHPNKEVIGALLDTKSLGDIIHKTIYLAPQLVHHQDIYVKTRQDKSICWISGITLLDATTLILTDYNNKSVKTVNLNNNTITDKLQLDSSPYGIAKVTADEVAVTLPKMGIIQFITVSSNQLSLKQGLRVFGECYGIYCHRRKLVVTFQSKEQLKILNLDNVLFSTVSNDISDTSIFLKPFYVTCNSHSIYVSDAKKREVMKINWQGELTGSYGGLEFPEGLAVFKDKTVFICDSDSGKILHLSGDLNTVDVVLKDLRAPQAICWCDTNSKMYISSTSNDTKHDNFIKIFTIP